MTFDSIDESIITFFDRFPMRIAMVIRYRTKVFSRCEIKRKEVESDIMIATAKTMQTRV